MNLIKNVKSSKSIVVTACLAVLSCLPGMGQAEDIDIFVGSSGGTADAPNVLIVLDNTSNWSRQSQQWPGGIQQGQAEVRAIKRAISSMTAANPVNVGLLEFVTKGNAGDDGGYVRQAITSMSIQANKDAFTTKLDTIFNDINGDKEKRNSNTAYGDLMYDAYNYYAGQAPFAVSADVSATDRADSNGYTTTYTLFKSPLSSTNSCAKNYIIFIGNSDSSGPVTDSAANTSALSALGGDTTQIPLSQYTTTTTTTSTSLGSTVACYGNNISTTECQSDATYTANCSSLYSSCTCSTPITSSGCSKNNTYHYSILGNVTTTTITPTGTSAPNKYNPLNADEWARFMGKKGVPVPGTDPTTYLPVVTYTIDVFNAQQNAVQTGLLNSMATQSGGSYFAARNEDQIVAALQQIFSDIQSVNTTFASASLPINATNRAQNANQVFIGMFRPDPGAKPRWYGNLKQYQLFTNSSGTIDLGDNSNPIQSAVNTQTGFLNDCAVSFWTTDSSVLDLAGVKVPYWKNVTSSPPASSQCLLSQFKSNFDPYSDMPDGAFVEKGGVSEILRKGNNPSVTSDPPYAVNRNIYSVFSGSLAPLTAASSGLSSTLIDFTLGHDTEDDNSNTNTTEVRPSVHGDVIHSRPLPVNYGDTRGVVAYYGSNDGILHAIQASSGKELWGFTAPEFFASDAGTRLQRLKANSPLVKFQFMPSSTSTTTTTPPIAKDYFFDGSIGLYQNADNTSVWIFPTMRRGGRKIYALDVSTPTAPVYKWSAGCTDTACTTNTDNMGQTWSMPNVAFVKGYSTTTPVIVVGGGYDSCEDADTATPACSTAKGSAVYVLDASDGRVIQSFPTAAPVAADISLIDIDNDGMADYAYAADLGGNLYRIDFIASPSARTPLSKNSWAMRQIAGTTGGGRKFFFAPALFLNMNKVYLALGSGDREHPLSTNYPYTTPITNRFYVYVDDLAVAANSTTAATNLDDTSVMANYSTDQGCNPSSLITPASTQKGWFMNLNENGRGEQTVTSALIAGGMVTFSTNRPIPPAQGTCSTMLGEARGYWVNLFNASGAIGVSGSCGGSRSTAFVGGGLPPSPVLATVSVGGKQTTVVIGAGQKDGKTSTPIAPQHLSPTISYKRKRIYWKQSGDN